MKIFAVANQKGGVGKTTTAVNLSAALAHCGVRVLLVDMDPQGNATSGSGLGGARDDEQSGAECCDLLLGESALDETIRRAERAGYDMIPSYGGLTAAEVGLMNREDRFHRLAEALRALTPGRCDYAILDCPPALNVLTVNALTAAHGLIVPLQCEYYALEGLSALLGTLERVRATHNPRLRLQGILRTMYDSRVNLARQVSEQLMTHFGSRVYDAVIPRNVRLAEAPSHGLPIIQYDPASLGGRAYVALAEEILELEREG